MDSQVLLSSQNALDSRDFLENFYRQLLQNLPVNLQSDGLKKTPQRAARAWQELTRGYGQNVRDIIGEATFPCEGTDMVIVKDIEIYSLCEHHLLPFFGKCHVGYIPNDKVVGLSKIPRIVDMYARRLQIQENLTREIASGIMEHIDCQGIGVVISAQHLCMMMRGVGQHNAITNTSCFLGSFQHDLKIREEFWKLLQISA